MPGNSRIKADTYRINCRGNFLMGLAAPDTPSIDSQDFELYARGNFNTNGNARISGRGYIACSTSGQVMLHSEISDRGVFDASPAGGNIFFLSGNTMTVNSSQPNTAVNVKPGCFLYSRSSSGVNQLLQIQNARTSIEGAVLVAERRIIVQSGADIAKSVVYVAYASSDQNNTLQITGSGTAVSGLIVSKGRASPSLRVNAAASVTGLAYQYGDAAKGRAQVDGGSAITGALLARQFHNDSFGPARVTYSLADIRAVLPQGFQGYATVEPNTWDDN